LAAIQLGRHSEKGQNTIIICQGIHILGWSWKALPIKRNELGVFGPLFFAVMLQALNKEI
jgi:hypothetical protein